MIEPTLLGLWGAWLLLLLLAAFRVFSFNFARRRQDRLWKVPAAKQARVALIVPVKGFDLQSTPRFFDAIFAQDYRDYRVIVCFESWQDPVAAWLREHLEVEEHHPVWVHPDPASGLRSVTLVCAGLSTDEGQKVHNQRAAFADLTADDAIIVFADADIQCGPDWLARLVAPINRGTHPLATTYRWLVPKRPTLPNQLASIINASITTQAGSDWSTILWGGSMAMTREVFDAIEVPSLIAGSLNDDLRISKVARSSGNRIAFVRSLILPTPIDFTWRGLFEFVKRQYTQVKFFSPILYTGTNLVLAFYVIGLASIVAALVYGYFLAWVPVAASYVIDQFRTLARQQIYLTLFPDNSIRQKLFAASWLEHMFTPLWMVLHWILLASTWTQNRVTWAGTRYRILSKSKTRILSRTETVQPLPAGAPGLAMMSALHDLRRPGKTEPILPFEPVSVPGAELTYTVAEEIAEVSVTTGRPLPATVVESGVADRTEAEMPTTAATFPGEAEAGFPSFPFGTIPSSISPLSAPPRRTRSETGRRSPVRTRGMTDAVSAAVTKTRVKPTRLFTTSASVSPSPAPRSSGPETRATRMGITFLPRLPRTRVERALCKIRDGAHGKTPCVSSGAPSLLPRSAPDRLSKKTRFPGFSTTPGKSEIRPLPTPTPGAMESGSKWCGHSENLSFSGPGLHRSIASRRVVSRSRGDIAPGRGVPARSSRTLLAAGAASPIACRPLSRGPSGRP